MQGVIHHFWKSKTSLKKVGSRATLTTQHLQLGGGNSNILKFLIPTWGRFPIWLYNIFSNGLKPSTSASTAFHFCLVHAWLPCFPGATWSRTWSRSWRRWRPWESPPKLETPVGWTNQAFEQWKKGPWLVRLYRGLYYPIIQGLIISHYKDPYKPTSIMEFFFVAHLFV